MDVIGIICEYNPFHNGHIYHIQKIKEIYPESLIILVLNGYFLERGEISLLSKEEKTNIALENNIDLVIELPFVFGSQSADIFAETSLLLLNELKCNKIIFGSESNDISLLKKIANIELSKDFNKKIKKELETGINYPTALNKAIGIPLDTPNDLLGVSYTKAILKNNYPIEPITIKRTNNYHDLNSKDIIISASNIREKLYNNEDISLYTPYASLLKLPNQELLFNILKTKIITEHNLSRYLTVDEGIEHRLIKEINNVNSTTELINKIKSKRYTFNRINRMLIHILIGVTKEDRSKLKIEYIKVLGFNSKGQKYLNTIKSNLLIQRKISDSFLAQQYELKAASIYDIILNKKALTFEKNNKPIKK